MNINDFRGEHVAISAAEVEAILSRRYEENSNDFYLSHGDETYPALQILFKGNAAYAYYYPHDTHCGFHSLTNGVVANPGGMSSFKMGAPATLDEIEVPNEAVISEAEALRVALEFLERKELPRAIKWFEL